jgi:hypothetical protein
MAKKNPENRGPRKMEKKETPTVPKLPEQKLDDLIYSLETKCDIAFAKQLVRHNMMSAMTQTRDPLPQFGFDDIAKEIRNKLPGLEVHQLEDRKTWLNGSVLKLTQLIELERKRLEGLSGNSDEKGRETYREIEESLHGMLTMRQNFHDLIDAVAAEIEQGKIKQETKEQVKNIQTSK